MFFELYTVDTDRLVESTTARSAGQARDYFSTMRTGKFYMVWLDDQTGQEQERTVSL